MLISALTNTIAQVITTVSLNSVGLFGLGRYCVLALPLAVV